MKSMKKKLILTFVTVAAISGVIAIAPCFAKNLSNDYKKAGQVIEENVEKINCKLISKKESVTDKTIKVALYPVKTQV